MGTQCRSSFHCLPTTWYGCYSDDRFKRNFNKAYMELYCFKFVYRDCDWMLRLCNSSILITSYWECTSNSRFTSLLSNWIHYLHIIQDSENEKERNTCILK